jgi:hypothetical protein
MKKNDNCVTQNIFLQMLAGLPLSGEELQQLNQ